VRGTRIDDRVQAVLEDSAGDDALHLEAAGRDPCHLEPKPSSAPELRRSKSRRLEVLHPEHCEAVLEQLGDCPWQSWRPGTSAACPLAALRPSVLDRVVAVGDTLEERDGIERRAIHGPQV